MSGEPAKIWAARGWSDVGYGFWDDADPGEATAYVRADLAEAKIKAAEAAAYERAANHIVSISGSWNTEATHARRFAEDIRALITDDHQSALDAVKQQVREECAQRVEKYKRNSQTLSDWDRSGMSRLSDDIRKGGE